MKEVIIALVTFLFYLFAFFMILGFVSDITGNKDILVVGFFIAIILSIWLAKLAFDAEKQDKVKRQSAVSCSNNKESDFMNRVLEKAGISILGGIIASVVLSLLGIEGSSFVLGIIGIGSLSFIIS